MIIKIDPAVIYAERALDAAEARALHLVGTASRPRAPGGSFADQLYAARARERLKMLAYDSGLDRGALGMPLDVRPESAAASPTSAQIQLAQAAAIAAEVEQKRSADRIFAIADAAYRLRKATAAA